MFFPLKLNRRKNQRALGSQPARFRPRIEFLEGRTLLSGITWYVQEGESGTQNGSKAHPFATIQEGVNAASDGDTVRVAPGTYQEQVAINKGIKLEGSGEQSTFIKAPSPLAGAIVDINAAHDVAIENFTIEGPASGPNNGGALFGIRVRGSGLATIDHNHITKIEDTPFGGPQEGWAIDVGLPGFAAYPSDTSTGSAVISQNLIDHYQKAGIFVGNAGSYAEIDHNTILGQGPTNVIGQNGVEIVEGAIADVNHNTVSENLYTGNNAAAAGILLYAPGAVTVDNNTVSNNDNGIDSEFASGPVIDHNQVTGSTYDGIYLYTTTNATVSHNDISRNGSGNTGDGGIALFNSANNIIEFNQSSKNHGDGIYVDSASTGNSFIQNQLNGNSRYDAEDASSGTGTSGTANTWQKNQGKTSQPGGLVH